MAASIYLGEITLRLPRRPLPGIDSWEIAAPENVEITSSDGLKMRARHDPILSLANLNRIDRLERFETLSN